MSVSSRKVVVYIAFLGIPFLLSAVYAWQLALRQPISVVVLVALVLFVPGVLILYYPIYNSEYTILSFSQSNECSRFSAGGAGFASWFLITTILYFVYVIEKPWLLTGIVLWLLFPLAVYVDLSLNVDHPNYEWVFACMVPALNILAVLGYIIDRKRMNES